MKKIIVLVAVMFAVMISTTASAVLVNNHLSAINTQTLCMTFGDLRKRRYEDDAKQKAEQQRLKEEKARKNEFYQFIFSITLAIGFIVMFLSYKYKNRRNLEEKSFMLWLSNFVNQKNLWILIFLLSVS